jgi:hypothetical protein
MKMKNLLIMVPVLLILGSCKTNELYINVLQPAPVTLSPNIKKVGIINRSMPTDETKIADLIDKTLSLEGADLDKIGAQESIAGLSEELGNNERFEEVKLLDNIDFRASRIGILPPPLSWRIVDSICTVTGTDALFALERYDTDTKISYSTQPGRKNTPLGSIPVVEHQASMQTIIKTGWRIYDPAELMLPDEFTFAESLATSGRGINPLAAIAALTGRKEAVKQVSRNAGHSYAMRILPFRLRVTRDYFVKGTDNFKIARRKAQTGKWDEAGKLWEIETGNPRRKIAGRASYNMAIINEINGSLESALDWAQKAWEDYKTRPALRYVRILEDRLYNNELLKVQEVTEE